MKKTPVFLCLVLLVGLGAFAACAGAMIDDKPAAVVVTAKLQAFAKVLSESIADTVVTPEEGQLLAASFQDLGGTIVLSMEQASSPDWGQIAGTVISSILLTFLGIRVAPNRMILGSAPDPEVARVAGLK